MKGTGQALDDLSTNYRQYMDKAQQQADINSNLRVMIVDDDDIYRTVVTQMLKTAHMQVVSFPNGKTALAGLDEQLPDLMLLDYHMPGLNGVEVLEQIKSNPERNAIPVIMLTGVRERDIVQKSIQAGAAGFIIKPSDRATILAKIDSVLKGD
jgi:two-component system NtrC family sensor kinase